MKSFPGRHTGGNGRGHRPVLRYTGQPGIQRRTVRRHADGPPKAVRSQHQHRGIAPGRQHRLIFLVALEGLSGGAVRLHQGIVRQGIPALEGRGHQLSLGRGHTQAYQTLPVQDLPGGVRLPCHGDARGGPDPGGRGHRHSAALPQLPGQVVHQGRLTAASDEGGDAGPDAQQVTQLFHFLYSPP